MEDVKRFSSVLTVMLLLVVSLTNVAVAQHPPKVFAQERGSRLSGLADRAVAEGELLRAEWKRASLQLAIRKYATARSYWRMAKATRREAEALKLSGDVYSVLSDYQGAIDSYNKALQLARSALDQQLEVDILNQISNTYLETANVKQAEVHCSQAREISRRIGYQRGAAESLNQLGIVNSISNDVLQAQQDLNQALAIWQQINHDEGRAYTLLNLGYLHSNLGNMQLALEFYERALTIWQTLGDRQKEALTLTAMGGVYAQQGEKQKALNLHNQALKWFRTMGNRSGEAATLNGIGYVYDDLGKRSEALKSYTSALGLYQSTNNRNYAAITLGYIGRVYFALGEKQSALKFYQEKLTTSRAVQDRRMEAYTLKDIGNVLSATDERGKALEYYKQALALSQAVMNRRGAAHVLNSIGSAYEQLGNLGQALDYYQQALPSMQAVADRRGEISTLYNIARAERDLAHLSEARTSIEKSLDLIENLRTKVVSSSLRVSYLNTVYQHYEFYVELLMQMDQRDPAANYGILALEASERARARTLLENLSEARTDIRQGVDANLLAEERWIQQQLNQKAEQQMRLLSGKYTPEQAAAIKKEIEILSAQYEEVESKVRDKSPRYAALTQPRQLKLADIQKELDPDTLLLEYSFGENQAYAWVVTATSVASFRLARRTEIEAAARESYRLLAASDSPRKNESRVQQRARLDQSAAAYPAVAAKLSRMLLQPVAALLGRKRLVIVADDVLQYIPFAALPEPEQAELEVKTWQPLIVNHEVVTLPSMSTLVALRQELRGRPLAPKALAVFADPVFERDDPRVASIKNKLPVSLSSTLSQNNQAHLRRRLLARETPELASGEDEPVTFERLPFTLQEAQTILSLVPQSESRQALGFDADLRTALDPDLRQYRVIHFATHGVLNNSHPELSGIVLSLIDRSGRAQDGFLRLNEIYNLDLPAELVVLSACRTALGRLDRGEGLIGLTRGFMHAGTPRVIASLWRIDDRAAAELMGYLYEAMFRQHLAPAAALRAAQIRMWQTREWRFPYYWAAFVIKGEWN